MKNYQITEWCRLFIKQHVAEGDLCIDATAGNGYDTLFLSRLAKEKGKVLAFDIQEAALNATRKRLAEAGSAGNVSLILDNHCHMDRYAGLQTVSCIVFNLGYLPGGDHSISTKPSTTLAALTQALALLKKGGLISLCIYSGGDSGFEERDAVLEWLKTLDPRQYLVILSQYYNRPNHPPIPVLIHKLK
ncbi:MAG: class I SAM-dependent methyltransferase [Ruminococcus sp.]|jgi:tRNA1(Val) A37 N6-methylase TrmN6